MLCSRFRYQRKDTSPSASHGRRKSKISQVVGQGRQGRVRWRGTELGKSKRGVKRDEKGETSLPTRLTLLLHLRRSGLPRPALLRGKGRFLCIYLVSTLPRLISSTTSHKKTQHSMWVLCGISSRSDRASIRQAVSWVSIKIIHQ